MKFTTHGKEVDKFVESKLKIVTKEIVNAIPDVYSVILMGGYGKGEGAIEIVNGKPRLMNDFDMYVITKKQLGDEFLEKLALKCSKLIGKGGIAHPEDFEDRYTFEKFFHIDIRCLPLKKLKNLPPAIRYYEMKNASTVLHGQDLSKQFPTIKSIPLPEALRIIMNRMMLLLMAYNPDFVTFKNYMTDDEKGILNYYIAKSYLTCCEALLILSNNFKPTYLGRTRVFSKIYKSRFPRLYKKFPELDKKVKFFTEYKLNPKPETVDTIKELYHVRNILGEIFKMTASKIINVNIIPYNWLQVHKMLKKRLAKPYFDPYADYYLRKYNLTKFNFLLNRCAQAYMSFKYYMKLAKDTKKINLSAISLKDPGVKILYSTPLVLYSINRDASEDKAMIELAVKELRKIYPSKKISNWKDARALYLKAYRLYYLQRFV